MATDAEDVAKGPLWLARATALALCSLLTAAAITPVPAPPQQPQPFDTSTGQLQPRSPLDRGSGAGGGLLEGLQRGRWSGGDRPPGSVDI